MKLINQCLTRKEASILCQTISKIEQTRPRVQEILHIEGNLGDNKLANRVASELLRGNIIRVDNKRMTVSNHSFNKFPEIVFQPVEIEQLEIYFVTGSKDRAHGPLDLHQLEQLLPELDIYDTYIFYRGLNEWKPLDELKQKYLPTR